MPTLCYCSELNKKIFIYINHITNTGIIPNIMCSISNIFNISNFAIFYVLVCIYCYFYIKNSNNIIKNFNRIYDELVRIGIHYTIFGLVFAGLKFCINLPRPFCSLNTDQFVTIANTATERCLSSFPSAHTGLSILVTYVLWPYTNSIYKCVCIMIVTIVAISRITLAMHYPTDLLYSMIITMIVILLGNIIVTKLRPLIIDPIKHYIAKYIFYV